MIPPRKWLFASPAGVLVAAGVVAVVRMAMRLGSNLAVSWRHTSAATTGNVERLAKPGGGLVRVRERERSGDFIADPSVGAATESRGLALVGDGALMEVDMRSFIIGALFIAVGVLGYLYWDSEHNTIFKAPGIEIKNK